MDRIEVIQKIEEFRKACKEYRALLVNSRDRIMPDIVRNHHKIDEEKIKLNRLFAVIEKYVVAFGNKPMMSDIGSNGYYSPYRIAFTSDILLRVGKCLDGVIDDLNVVLGRIEASSDEEFEEKMNPPKEREKEQNNNGTIIANGGKGGDGSGGGRGGDGGIGIIAQYHPRETTVQDIENIHHKYWRMIFKKIFDWIVRHTVKLLGLTIAGLVLAYLVFKLGWN